MEQVALTDTAQQFVGKINDNFEEAGIVSSLSYTSNGNEFVGVLNEKFAQPNNAISVNDTGNDFVRKINENFENLAPIVPGEARVITIPMQAGILENGYSKDYAKGNSTSISSDIWRYMHSSQLLGLTNCTIHSVSLQSGESLSISYYNENGAYLGVVNSVSSIPSTAKFARFQVSIPTTVGDNLELRDLEVTITGADVRRKNAAHATDKDRTRITFEVKKPYKFPVYENDDKTQFYDYIGEDRLYDNGYVVLPSSYTPTGAPTDLAVFIQGTGGFYFNNGINDNTYRETQSFIARNGIAVCCCSGVTSKYPTVRNLMFGPLFCESVASMVDYIKANYNIGKVFIYGKSSGGMLTNFAPLVTYIGAVCVGSIAPAFGPITSRLYVSLGTYVRVSIKIVAKDQLDAALPDTPTIAGWRDKAVEYSKKWRMFDAFFSAYSDEQIPDDNEKDIELDTGETKKIGFKYIIDRAFYNTNEKSIYGLMQFDDYIKKLIESLTRPFPVPHKVWCAPDDNAVSYYACEALCNNSQGYTFSALKRDTGGHNADGTGGQNNPETFTPEGGGETFYRAYWELVDWFKSHSNTN